MQALLVLILLIKKTYAGGGSFEIIRTRDLEIMSNALIMEAGALTRLSFRVNFKPRPDL